jgi:hypothetical protein
MSLLPQFPTTGHQNQGGICLSGFLSQNSPVQPCSFPEYFSRSPFVQRRMFSFFIVIFDAMTLEWLAVADKNTQAEDVRQAPGKSGCY